MDGLGLTLVALTMLVGVFGVFIPMLPGLLLVWAAGLVWVLQSEGALRWMVLVVLTVLAVIGTVAKYVLGGRAVAATGAPRSTLALGVLGAIVGFFVIPVLGLVIGGVVGVLLAERARLGGWHPAWSATWALIVGFGLGMLIELLAAVVMVAVWGAGALVVAL